MQALTLSSPFRSVCGRIRRSCPPASAPSSRLTKRFILRSQTDKKPAPETSNVATEEDVPIWVRREEERKLQREMGEQAKDLPWPLYLLLSTLTTIASIGSMFEYVNQNPVFGVIPPDNPAWAPILGFFALTGIPSAGFFFFKGVSGANQAAEMQDKLDGYRE